MSLFARETELGTRLLTDLTCVYPSIEGYPSIDGYTHVKSVNKRVPSSVSRAKSDTRLTYIALRDVYCEVKQSVTHIDNNIGTLYNSF